MSWAPCIHRAAARSRRLAHPLPVLLALLLPATVAHAHVGSKDVFEQVAAGPYKLFVTVRPPTVIPGVATVEVRSYGAPIDSLTETPTPLTGEASKHPPAADAMTRSTADPAFFTGQLWIMASGSWEVRFTVMGAGGRQQAAVPVAAVSTSILRMQRPLEMILGALGLLLAIGVAGIIAAAVRESRLRPGLVPDGNRRRRALLAGGFAFLLVAGAVALGNKWWNVEAAGYAGDLYRPSELHPTLTGNTLQLVIGDYDQKKHAWVPADQLKLLPDHGHLMHLYAIRWPAMDAVYHLHPTQSSPGELTDKLPAMVPGEYHLYGDIVHPNGFPETLTATLTIPPAMRGSALSSEDASATPPPVAAGMLGETFRLPDGYTMVWNRPASLKANAATLFTFHLLNPQGQPATNVQPYLGMAGHAAFVKTDGAVFAHTHPEGSAAMPAMMMANDGAGGGMGGPAADSAATPQPLDPEVTFPYGFPSAGRYRIFIQMKHGGTVETGVFDAEVQPS